MAIEPDEFVRTLLAERGALIGFIHSLVRDGHLAEDVFQAVMVAALSKREQIVDRRHALKWLRKAARLEALSQIRKQATQPAGLDESVLDLLEANWERQDAHAGSDRADALRQCVERLTPKARKLLSLRYGESLSGERLASTVGRSLNTVYVALSRIHRTLADCIRSRLDVEGANHG